MVSKLGSSLRCVPSLNEGNPGLKEGSMELCSMGGSLDVHLKSQCLTSVRKGGPMELCLRGGLLGWVCT